MRAFSAGLREEQGNAERDSRHRERRQQTGKNEESGAQVPVVRFNGFP